MRISIVVTTYKWPQALTLVLAAIARQTRLPHEVVVSEDAHDQGTADAIRAAASGYPCPLMHLWQADEGFRLSRTRNRAISVARGDYIVFLDGDMVAERHFVADHAAFARTGCFVQGSRAITSEARSRRMLSRGELDVGFFSSGVQRRRNAVRAPWIARLNARPHQRGRGIKSCNMAFWRDDLVHLNGFNERMVGWGREDRDLVERAFHAGMRQSNLRFCGLATHLWHQTRKQVQDNPNDKVLAETRARRLIRCELGLNQHATGPVDASRDEGIAVYA